MNEPLKILHTQLQSVNDKYCYFLLTAAGACIGYATEKSVGHAWTLPLAVLALAIVAWGMSFVFGCYYIKHIKDALWSNISLLETQDPTDKAAHRLLFNRSSRKSKTAERWQFRCFVIGGMCFVIWRGWNLLPG